MNKELIVLYRNTVLKIAELQEKNEKIFSTLDKLESIKSELEKQIKELAYKKVEDNNNNNYEEVIEGVSINAYANTNKLYDISNLTNEELVSIRKLLDINSKSYGVALKKAEITQDLHKKIYSESVGSYACRLGLAKNGEKK